MKFAVDTAIVNLITYVLVVAAFPAEDNRSEAHISSTADAGGPHGDIFDDIAYSTTNHKRIASIKLWGCGPDDHLTKIELGYRDNKGSDVVTTVSHGGHSDLKSDSLDLNKDEYIIQIATTTWMKNVGTFRDIYHTRIGSIDIYTNQGNRLKCGASWFGQDPVQQVKPDYYNGALLYLSGRSGEAIDKLTAHWIPGEDF